VSGGLLSSAEDPIVLLDTGTCTPASWCSTTCSSSCCGCFCQTSSQNPRYAPPTQRWLQCNRRGIGSCVTELALPMAWMHDNTPAKH
jgi:hypothetical protein